MERNSSKSKPETIQSRYVNKKKIITCDHETPDEVLQTEWTPPEIILMAAAESAVKIDVTDIPSMNPLRIFRIYQ